MSRERIPHPKSSAPYPDSYHSYDNHRGRDSRDDDDRRSRDRRDYDDRRNRDPRRDERRSEYNIYNAPRGDERREYPKSVQNKSDENDPSMIYAQQLHQLLKKQGPSVIVLAKSIFEAAEKENHCTVFVFQSILRVLSEQAVDIKSATDLLEYIRKIWGLVKEKGLINYRILSSYLHVLIKSEKYDEVIKAYDAYIWPEQPNEFESQKYAEDIFAKTVNLTAYHYMLACKNVNNIEKAKVFFNKILPNKRLSLESKKNIAQLYFELCKENKQYDELDNALEHVIASRCVTDRLVKFYLNARYLSSPNQLVEKASENFWRIIVLFYENKLDSVFNKEMAHNIDIMVKWIINSDANEIIEFLRKSKVFNLGVVYKFFISALTECVIKNSDESYFAAKKIFLENTCNLYSQHFAIFEALMLIAMLKKDVEFAKEIYLRIKKENPHEKNKTSANNFSNKIQNMFLNVAINAGHFLTSQNNPDEIYKSIKVKDALGYASFMWYLLREKRYTNIERIFMEAQENKCLSAEVITCYLLFLMKEKFNIQASMIIEQEEGECETTDHPFANLFEKKEISQYLNSDHFKLFILAADKSHMEYVKRKVTIAGHQYLLNQACEELFNQYCNPHAVPESHTFEEVILSTCPFKDETLNAPLEKFIERYKPFDYEFKQKIEPAELTQKPTIPSGDNYSNSSSSTTQITTQSNELPKTFNLSADRIIELDDDLEEGELPEVKNTDVTSISASTSTHQSEESDHEQDASPLPQKKKKKPRKKRKHRPIYKPRKKRRVHKKTKKNDNHDDEVQESQDKIVNEANNEKQTEFSRSAFDADEYLDLSDLNELPDEFELEETSSSVKSIMEAEKNKNNNLFQSNKKTPNLTQFFSPLPNSSQEDDEDDEEDDDDFVDELNVSIKEIHKFILDNQNQGWTDARLALEFFKFKKLRGSEVQEYEQYYLKAALEAVKSFLLEVNNEILEEGGKKISLLTLKKTTPKNLKALCEGIYDQKMQLYSIDKDENEDNLLDEMNQTSKMGL